MKINNVIKLSIIAVVPFLGSPLFAMEFAQKAYAYVTAQFVSGKSEDASQISNTWIEENQSTNSLNRARILMGHVSPGIKGDVPEFKEWKKRCDTNIAHFNDSFKSMGHHLHDFSKTATNYQEFMKAVNAFITFHQEHELVNPALWVNNDAFNAQFFGGPTTSFKPFTQAVRVAPGTEIVMFGDRHGDVRSTLEMITELSTKGYFEPNSFKLKPNVLLLGLGDYVDRGNAGVETLATMLWLKLQNPDQVILVRGNHEDCSYKINKTQFQFELKQKLGKAVTQADIDKVNRIYDCLPVAVFIGCGNSGSTHFMIGCHGFLEAGYHPKDLLDMAMKQPLNISCFEKMGALQRMNHIKQLSTESQKAIENTCKTCNGFSRELSDIDGGRLADPVHPYRLGWMWSYAIVDNGTKPLAYDTMSHTWQWGKTLTEDVLSYWSKPSEYTLSWIFRGHQHSHNEEYRYYPEIMNKLWKNNGLYKLWSAPGKEHSLESRGAFTVNVAPDNVYAGTNQKIYPGFNYDTWIAVKTGATGTNWTIKVFNKSMFALPECPVNVDGKMIVPQMPYKAPVLTTFEKNKDNFYAVDPGKFYRAKLLPTNVLELYLKNHNIKTLINLREPDPNASWFKDEVALCKKLGITMHNINFHPTRLPTREQMIQLFTIFDNHDKYPILVHCLAGADRTGLVAALYVIDKMRGNIEQALKQQDAFFGHNVISFPHLRKFTYWWVAMQKKFDSNRTAILAAYDAALFMEKIVMPRLSEADLYGRV